MTFLCRKLTTKEKITMSTTQITKKIEDLLELEQIMEEAKAELELHLIRK